MRVSISVLVLAAVSGTSQAFAPVTWQPGKHVAHSSTLFMSEPSDTSSDPFFDDVDDGSIDVESRAFSPTAAEALVNNVLDMMPGGGMEDISEGKRASINEVLLKLEAMNPTKEPALSPLLNGVWELRYAGGYSSEGALPSPTRQLALFLYSGGYSPGLFALSLAQKFPSNLVDTGDLEISICREQPRVEAKVIVKTPFSSESTVSVKTELKAVSDCRLRETYESVTVMDRTTEIPDMFQYSRDIYVTYLDDDLLIVRDASGVPELLLRKQKTFSKSWGTEPAEVEDMGPPGTTAGDEDISPSDV